MTWTVLARRPDRTVAGVLSGWTLTLTLNFNEVGSWSLTLPRESAPTGWPSPGSGVYIMQGSREVASGTVDVDAYNWAADPSSEYAGPGRWTLNGDTDLGRIAYRIVYPDPTRDWAVQNVLAQYVRGRGQAEVLMNGLVSDHAGPGALLYRQVPGLTVAPAAGVGTATTVAERFTPLLDALRTCALAGGGLGFDVVGGPAGTLVFDVFAPRDVTRTARFGIDMGNVVGLTATRTSPTATVALVAGSGVGTARQTLEQADPAADPAYGRRETFIDQRQTTDPAEYLKAALEGLATAGEQVTVPAEIVDTLQLQWGRDYNLGDRVTIATHLIGSTDPVVIVSDLVRQVRVEVSAIGDALVTSTIGTATATGDRPTDLAVRALLRRVSLLERAV